MRSLTIMIPLDLPKSAIDWQRFQQIVQARFRETKSRPFGELDGRVGLAFIVNTSRLLDNTQVPLVLRRLIKHMYRAKVLKTFDVHCRHGEVKPSTGTDYIDIVLYEEPE
jgi:hypothetical protein